MLSLGPLLKVGNELALYRVDAYRSHVVLPYALLKQVPLLRVWLRGWRTDGSPWHAGGVLTVALDWETAAELTDQYVGFVHLLSPDGALVAQHDGPLVEGLLSPAVVPSGAIFRYPVALDLPESLPAGDYRLLAGVYLWPSLERLPVLAGVVGAEEGAVELERVEIVP